MALAALVLCLPTSAQQVVEPNNGPALPAPFPPKTLPQHEWLVRAPVQEHEGNLVHLRGNPAELEDYSMLLRADEIDLNKETHDVEARGHVYYHNFDKNEELWCDHMEYNTEKIYGRFYEVRGETHPRIASHPGMLTTTAPFHFEGKWAERIGEKYIVYDGWVTNCTLPDPWWKFKGKRFDIYPDDHAVTHNSVFWLRRMPLFYTPFYYHALGKVPRNSGFLTPNLGHQSQRGILLGLGYFWAINRSYDLSYRFQDFTARGYTHNAEFRGKPIPGTDFDLVFYDVQDRGVPGSNPPDKFSGLSVFASGKSDLGDGWTVHGYGNFVSSFRFTQEWAESFNEAIGSEIHAIAFLNKDWSNYTFNVVASRVANYQTSEVNVAQPTAATPNPAPIYDANDVVIRKLPEAEFSGSDKPLFGNLPIWLSFDSSAGLMFRSEPFFNYIDGSGSPQVAGSTLVDKYQTSAFTDRLHLAPHLTTALHLGDFHLVPSLGFYETFYSESQAPNGAYERVVGTNVLAGAREFSLDLIFPTFYRVFNKKTIFGDKLKHVIEPRATYRYVTGIGSDFNRLIRFDETDLLANTNEVALSLTNRVYAKRGESVQEIFTWELMQKRYFNETFGGALLDGQRNIFDATSDVTAFAFLVGPRSTSPVDSLLRFNPIGGLTVIWQADYDPRLHGITNSTLSLGYRWQRYFFSGGNNSVHDNTILAPYANQFNFRLGIGDFTHRGFNAAFDALYDYRVSKFLSENIQVTYNTNCCGLSVEYRRYNIGVRDDTLELFSFTIANVASPFGTLRKQDRLF
jgi:LPS-assembly protein